MRYRERHFRRLARIGEFRYYWRTSGGGERAKHVLLFLLAVGVFLLASGLPLPSVIMAVPLLVIGGVLGNCLVMLLFGEAGLIAFALVALLSLFA